MDKLVILALYFFFLFLLSFLTSKNSTLSDYFNGSKKASWLLISFGMISDTLSGVTYISVPGSVSTQGISYLYVSLGYVVGNLLLCFFILPHYFKKKIISIYEILTSTMGREATLICSFLFLIARSFGSAARLFLSLTILYPLLHLHQVVSFPWICVLSVFIIYIYTLKGGIKSLIVTDVYHSSLLLLGFFAMLYFLTTDLDFSIMYFMTSPSFPTQPFFDSHSSVKSFVGGIFITLAMYGLDQNMMQKCLSCNNLKNAQKNILLSTFFSLILNVSFVCMGLLIIPAYQRFHVSLPLSAEGIVKSDELLIYLLQNVAPEWLMILFLLGLLAATFSSSDAVITTLTTSFYRDILHEKFHSKVKVEFIHGVMGLVIIMQLLLISMVHSSSMITFILKVSSYIYAPLIGIFLLYLLQSSKAKKGTLTFTTMMTLAASYPITNSIEQQTQYHFGLELLLFNAVLFLVIYVVQKNIVEKMH